ncbi:MAG: isoprenylcysteine carboxylmethyltransferase family protein [Nibricoccus sp.]
MILFTSSRWEAVTPVIAELLFFFGVICVGIAALGRVWCSLYIAGRKDRQLVCEGPYSLTRNPLYFFSFIGIIGAGLATETITIPLFFLATFSIYYPFVISAEERKLAVLFPQDFPSYCQRVPRFFPRLAGFIEPDSYTVNPSIVRRHMCSVVWFIWIVGFLEIIELLHERGILPVYWNVY